MRIKKAAPSKRFRPPERNRILLDGTLESVDRLAISAQEVGPFAEPFAWQMTSRESVRERIPCHHPECFDGGFSLGDLLRELIKSRQADYIGTSYCTGQMGDPELVAERPSCATRFNVTLHLSYR